MGNRQGWFRLWVVLSVLWLAGVGAATYFDLSKRESPCDTPLFDGFGVMKGLETCTVFPEWEAEYADEVSEAKTRYVVIAFAPPIAIPLLWFILAGVVNWVRAGFASGAKE